MSGAARPFSIPHDWYQGTVPLNIVVAESAYVETSRSFLRFHSRREPGLIVEPGAALYNTSLDVGPNGCVRVGEYALLSSAMIICDREVTIGASTMFAWDVVVLDSYRGVSARSRDDGAALSEPKPVCIGANVWIGFASCVLPGVTIGDGTVVAARSVVNADLPPYCVAAGNPARVVRYFDEA